MSEPQSDPLLITILSASNFVIGMGAFLVIGVLTPIANDLQLNPAQAGQIMTIYALSYAVLSPMLVSITGRIGRRRVMAAGLALFALGGLVAALSNGAVMLNFSRVIAAAGAGMFTPIAAATAAGLSSPERRGRALAAVFFGLTLAQVVGVPAGSFIAYTFGWRVAFFIVVALALPCIWLVWTRVPAGLTFQTIHISDLGRVLRNFPLMLAVLFTTSFLGSIYVVFTYLAPLFEVKMGFERNGVTLALLSFGIGAVIGNMLGGVMADRLGPAKTLLAVSLALVVITPLFSALPMSEVAALTLVFVWSVVGWSFMASQQSRLIALASEQASVVLALNAAGIYVGAAAGSALGGAVLAKGGLGWLGIAGGLTALVAVAHTIWSNRISPSNHTPTR